MNHILINMNIWISHATDWLFSKQQKSNIWKLITLNISAWHYFASSQTFQVLWIVRAWTITILTFMKVTRNSFFPVLRISFLSRLRTPIHTGWKAVWNVAAFAKKELSRFASSFYFVVYTRRIEPKCSIKRSCPHTIFLCLFIWAAQEITYVKSNLNPT